MPACSPTTRFNRKPSACAAVLCLLFLVPSAGCAPTQLIALDVSPYPVVVFVDGERVDDPHMLVKLKTNKDHTLFFQREGYRSQLIIVRTIKGHDGRSYLSPASVEVVLKRATTSEPSISVELDESED